MSKTKSLFTYNISTAAGTTQWMAPELFDDKSCTFASDIYAYGMVLWEIASREMPYKNVATASEIIKMKCSGNDLEIPLETPSSHTKIIFQCWRFNPDDRPTAKELLERYLDN